MCSSCLQRYIGRANKRNLTSLPLSVFRNWVTFPDDSIDVYDIYDLIVFLLSRNYDSVLSIVKVIKYIATPPPNPNIVTIYIYIYI